MPRDSLTERMKARARRLDAMRKSRAKRKRPDDQSEIYLPRDNDWEDLSATFELLESQLYTFVDIVWGDVAEEGRHITYEDLGRVLEWSRWIEMDLEEIGIMAARLRLAPYKLADAMGLASFDDELHDRDDSWCDYWERRAKQVAESEQRARLAIEAS